MIRKTAVSGTTASKGSILQATEMEYMEGKMNDYLAKIKKDMMGSFYLKKIEGDDWYNGRFVQLCIILFFLVGLFSGLTVGGSLT